MSWHRSGHDLVTLVPIGDSFNGWRVIVEIGVQFFEPYDGLQVLHLFTASKNFQPKIIFNFIFFVQRNGFACFTSLRPRRFFDSKFCLVLLLSRQKLHNLVTGAEQSPQTILKRPFVRLTCNTCSVFYSPSAQFSKFHLKIKVFVRTL